MSKERKRKKEETRIKNALKFLVKRTSKTTVKLNNS